MKIINALKNIVLIACVYTSAAVADDTKPAPTTPVPTVAADVTAALRMIQNFNDINHNETCSGVLKPDQILIKGKLYLSGTDAAMLSSELDKKIDELKKLLLPFKADLSVGAMIRTINHSRYNANHPADEFIFTRPVEIQVRQSQDIDTVTGKLPTTWFTLGSSAQMGAQSDNYVIYRISNFDDKVSRIVDQCFKSFVATRCKSGDTACSARWHLSDYNLNSSVESINGRRQQLFISSNAFNRRPEESELPSEQEVKLSGTVHISKDAQGGTITE